MYNIVWMFKLPDAIIFICIVLSTVLNRMVSTGGQLHAPYKHLDMHT